MIKQTIKIRIWLQRGVGKNAWLQKGVGGVCSSARLQRRGGGWKDACRHPTYFPPPPSPLSAFKKPQSVSPIAIGGGGERGSSTWKPGGEGDGTRPPPPPFASLLSFSPPRPLPPRFLLNSTISPAFSH